MTSSSGPISVRFSENIRWVIDCTQIIVVNDADGCSMILKDWEAVVWSYLARGYTPEQAATPLSQMRSILPAQAAQDIHSALRCWYEAGWLQPVNTP
jgi:hypothetical protein